MAITNTTLNVAITGYDTTIYLASTTGVTAPVPSTAVGETILYIDNEFMRVESVPVAGKVIVKRGWNGSQATAHVKSSVVLIGGNNDFPLIAPKVGAFTAQSDRYQGVSAPVAAAAKITAPGAVFHITGTTTVNIINPPANFVEGNITVIPDGAFNWGSSAVQYGVAYSGGAVVGTSVIFTYDAVTQLWYPTEDNGTTTLAASTPAAATLAAPGGVFHVTGTTAVNIITPPTNFSSTSITIIADGVLTWTSSAVANGIAQSGTVTSAGETVTFTYDPATTYWYPSRVA